MAKKKDKRFCRPFFQTGFGLFDGFILTGQKLIDKLILHPMTGANDTVFHFLIRSNDAVFYFLIGPNNLFGNSPVDFRKFGLSRDLSLLSQSPDRRDQAQQQNNTDNADDDALNQIVPDHHHAHADAQNQRSDHSQ